MQLFLHELEEEREMGIREKRRGEKGEDGRKGRRGRG